MTRKPGRSAAAAPTAVAEAVSRSAVVRWAVYAAAAGVVLAAAHSLWVLRTGDDFAVYWKGGWSLLHGRSLYGSRFPNAGPFRTLPFTYPPFAALLFAPFAAVLAGTAMLAWTALSLLALAALVVALVPQSTASSRTRRAGLVLVLTAGCVMLRPVREGLALGQVGILLTLACYVDISSERNRLPRGVLIGLATAVKLTPAVFVVHLVLTRQWKAARNAAATVIACWTLAFAVSPKASVSYFLHGVAFDTTRIGAVTAPYNQSLNGLLARSGVPGRGVWWLLASAAVVGYGLTRAGRAHRAGDLRSAAVIVGMVMLLVSPISWLHHAIWVVPLLGLLLTSRRNAAIAAGVGLTAFLLYVGSTANTWLLDGYVLCYLAAMSGLPIRREMTR